MDQYLPLLVMFVLALAFAGLSFVASTLLGQRRRPTLAKVAPYECGIVPDREPAERFPVRFYLVAMLFIILDIEIIFLFPWAVIYRDLGAFGLWEMIAFGSAVFVSFIFLIGRGALNWGPRKRTTPVSSAVAGGGPGERSTDSTIRRVGDFGVREVGATGRVPAAAGGER
ncbi:MAG: NADH-quinone oxidoreductase subunit A [Actinomycetota bacterium]|nr:NADH-quinone oxidoreductase subunit A [Actinomycetota bacterium]